MDGFGKYICICFAFDAALVGTGLTIYFIIVGCV